MPLKVDPLLTLAIAIHSSPGVYALLIGSGVSRSAGIPTGWDVVLDLIRQLAALSGEDFGTDPVRWYEAKFAEPPDYSKLLDQLAKTPAERRNLLRHYFEPTEEDHEQGLRVPTRAHHSIAHLVVKGYVRVILTTNFDRLLEQALEAAGVFPTVIAGSGAQAGAVPIVHSLCTVVKLHGDYLDSRIRNTINELAQYDQASDILLDRVLDDYGLVVCGWSGVWDTALRAAILRAPNRRYTTFWATRGMPDNSAQQLIDHRATQVMSISNADTFFASLDEKITALEDLSAPHPLSVDMAVATLKRYIVEERHKIAMYDLMADETEALHQELASGSFPAHYGRADRETVKKALTAYESAISTCQALLVAGCYWGEPQQAYLWTRLLERIGNRSSGASLSVADDLTMYPSLLLMYAGGIASLVGKKPHNLRAVLIDARIADAGHRNAPPAVLTTNARTVVSEKFAQDILGRKVYASASEMLFERIRPVVAPYLPRQEEYDAYFDLFEYAVCLTFADLDEPISGKFRFPYGRFGWKFGSILTPNPEIVSPDNLAPLLDVGFFGGSRTRLDLLATKLMERLGSQDW